MGVEQPKVFISYNRADCDWAEWIAGAIERSGYRTLRVWDLKNGGEFLKFNLDATVTTCSVAQNNGTIVAGDGFGRLHFLQLIEADQTKPGIGETKIRLLRGKE